ncbi:kinase [Nonomuraea jabiensis]|uniref:Thymidylate kinase n=1 Tax=Nonomuraea jabiensis TaxID=882448 RepID=A0A7W9G5N6_9ACTN|nr:kinase [Nonomuraea jabiensis]MBB5777675.1 thymidylate kinase [Nonomuraea jabiensis]
MLTQLIVLRGNSGSGKTSVARALRKAYGKRGLAVVGQDVLRRDILRELDVPDGVNIGLIDTVTRYALDHGHHVILEGILTACRYAPMLQALREDFPGRSRFFYLDVPFEETLRRHATRPQSAEFGPDMMREWYIERDLLPGGYETIIDQHSSLEETVRRLLSETLERTETRNYQKSTRTPANHLID